MRANHAVTLGLCVGLTGLAMWAAGCGTDTFGTCNDNNTCGGGGGDASVDGEIEGSTPDSSMTVDTGSAGDSGTSDTSVASDTGTVGDGSTKDAAVSCEAGTVACNGACVNEQTDPRLVQQGVRGAGRGDGDGAVHVGHVQRGVQRQHDAGLQRDVLRSARRRSLRIVLDGVPGADQRQRVGDVHGQHARVRDCVQQRVSPVQRSV
jgi:hypothetical protein